MNIIVILNKTFSAMFAAICIGATYGVVFKGAWWQIFFATVSFVMAIVFSREAKKERSR